MPIYDYSCDNGHNLSKTRKVEERDSTLVCEVCGEEMKRGVSLPSEPHFHASGFTPRFHGSGGRKK